MDDELAETWRRQAAAGAPPPPPGPPPGPPRTDLWTPPIPPPPPGPPRAGPAGRRGRAVLFGAAAAGLLLGGSGTAVVVLERGGSSAAPAPSALPTPRATTPVKPSASPTPTASANPSPAGGVNTINAATVKKGGSFGYTLGKRIANWNLLNADGNTFELAEVMDAVMPSAFVPQPDAVTVQLNSDLLVSATETSTGPQTVVYRIRPQATWSDGVPITGEDFRYTWQVQDPRACPDCVSATTSGYDQIRGMTESADKRTVTVVFATPFLDWKSLFSPLLPAQVAARYGSLATPAGLAAGFNAATGTPAPGRNFADGPPTWSGGPYIITSYSKDRAVTLKPNPRWYGAKGPYLDTLTFTIITDPAQEVSALDNGAVQAIYPQPDAAIVDEVKALTSRGVSYQLGQGLAFEHFDLNLDNPVLRNVAVRRAMFTAVDTRAVIARTVGGFAPDVVPLGSRMFFPGQPAYVDHNVPLGYGSGNTTKAQQILTGAGYRITTAGLVQPDGTRFPTLVMRYTAGNLLRKAECDQFKNAVADLGISVDVEPTNSLGATLTHQARNDCDVVVFAWISTAFPGSGNQPLYTSATCTAADRSGCGGNYGSYQNPAVDRDLEQAVHAVDVTTANRLLNDADAQISADAYTLPLYQKPTLLAFSGKFGNVRDNPASVGPPYNVQEWGLRS